MSTLPVTALCTVVVNGDNLSIIPLGVIVDLKSVSSDDQSIYKGYVIPQVLTIAASFLSNQSLPNFGFQEIALGAPSLAVRDGYLAVAFSLQGAPTPPSPSNAGLPNLPFFLLLSATAEQGLVGSGVAALNGKTVGTGGSQSFGIGSASYKGDATINQIMVAPLSGDLTLVNASIILGAGAGADATVDMPWPSPNRS